MQLFSADDVFKSTSILDHFMHVCTWHFVFRISIFYFSNGKILAPINHMKSANIQNPVGIMKVTGICLA